MLVVPLAGMAVMLLELASARMLAPYFGQSLAVWNAVLSLSLLGLAIGYAGAARLSKAWGAAAASGAALLVAAAWLAVDAVAHRPLLAWLARTLESDAIGSALAMGLLAAAPMSALGALPVWEMERSARPKGFILAAGTAGNLLGAMLASFILLPKVGVRGSLLAAAVLLALAGLAFVRSARAAAAGALGLFVLGALLFEPWAFEQLPPPIVGTRLELRQSSYHQLEVLELLDRRMLLVDLRTTPHTSSGHGESLGTYHEALGLAATFVAGDRVLAIGLGGGEGLHAARRLRADLSYDAVERDPAIVALARAHFALDRIAPLRVFVDDGRRFLARADSLHYDIVQLDAYGAGPEMPAHLATVEFFAELRRHMTDDSVLAMNVVDPSAEGVLAGRVHASLRPVFAETFEIRRSANRVLFAFTRATGAERRAELHRAGLRPGIASGGPLSDDRSELEVLSRTFFGRIRS